LAYSFAWALALGCLPEHLPREYRCVFRHKVPRAGARGAEKKKMTKATYICRGAKKKVVTSLFYFYFYFIFYRFFKGVFWAFRNKGSSKTRKKNRKNPSRLRSSQKMRHFFIRFCLFFPSPVVLFDFFHRVFGRFVTRGVQKRDKKKSRENLLSLQKRYLLTYLRRFFFSAAPLGCWLLGWCG
jgi:hypothetical protein